MAGEEWTSPAGEAVREAVASMRPRLGGRGREGVTNRSPASSNVASMRPRLGGRGRGYFRLPVI